MCYLKIWSSVKVQKSQCLVAGLLGEFLLSEKFPR